MRLHELSELLAYLTVFSIRSFGSWGEARERIKAPVPRLHFSVSALSDRGVRQMTRHLGLLSVWLFQYPLFRIVG